MIVADASWIIALRDPADGHHAAAVTVNETTADQEIMLHPVTLSECLVAPAKLGDLDDAARKLRAAYEIIDVDIHAPERWARLRAHAGLRLPDAIVLDAALAHRATAILTFDDNLAAAATKRNIAINCLGIA